MLRAHANVGIVTANQVSTARILQLLRLVDSALRSGAGDWSLNATIEATADLVEHAKIGRGQTDDVVTIVGVSLRRYAERKRNGLDVTNERQLLLAAYTVASSVLDELSRASAPQEHR